jgi:hypothetical protein
MAKRLILIGIVFFCVFESAFSFAQDTSSVPEVCSAPSAGMILYQNFQEEMKAALL